MLLLVSVCALPVLGEGAARLLVQKSLDHHTLMPHNFAIDSPINVTLQVINAGDAVASAIKLEDSWLSGFELSGPVGPWSWESLAPGASVNVSYFVTPTTQGPFESSPARVTYTPSEGASQQVGNTVASGGCSGLLCCLLSMCVCVVFLFQIGYSSSATNLNVIGNELFSKLTSTHTLEWGLFGGLLALFVLAPFARYYELSSSYSKAGRRKGE